MKKKIFSVVATLLLSCCFAFAQNGGMQVELKPFNPQNKPPYGNVTTPYDTIPSSKPTSIEIEGINFECFKNKSWSDKTRACSSIF